MSFCDKAMILFIWAAFICSVCGVLAWTVIHAVRWLS